MSEAKFDFRGLKYSNDRAEKIQTNVLGIMWDKISDRLYVNVPLYDVLAFLMIKRL